MEQVEKEEAQGEEPQAKETENITEEEQTMEVVEEEQAKPVAEEKESQQEQQVEPGMENFHDGAQPGMKSVDDESAQTGIKNLEDVAQPGMKEPEQVQGIVFRLTFLMFLCQIKIIMRAKN